MTTRIFIDGGVGTTGIEIGDRLAGRPELTVLTLAEKDRKDAAARREALNEADIVILCLPDDAAREAVTLIDNDHTRVIDASTAHRVADGWTYGFPELEPGHREKLANSRFVANPGCWPTGFLALVRPLTLAGLLPADWPVTVSGASGYSGGGKAMIAEYEGADGIPTAFRAYGLSLAHKHVPEMTRYSGLTHPPIFAPAVASAYRGMLVEIPLQLRAMPQQPSLADVHAAIASAYAGSPLVSVASLADSAAIGQVEIEHVGATDRLKLFVFGNAASGQARLVAALDNLGKGAAGAAVQNLNILAGLPETAGLRL
ncbi:MAG: N-acetyl-gamma-glutamyl-phosphate reductase [Sphingomonadaceae bacterium]|nr:N-acetyl-gamma-glutamyl-phosphate reductase [Sphingomonadaceae bacterium]